MQEKIFTLEEANKLLPRLKQLLEKANVILEQLKISQPEIHPERAKDNGGNHQGPLYVQKVGQLEQITNSISTKGVIIKDLQRGLCDFPYLRDGRVVYLCWEFGESQIEWWHEIADGFRGRQRLLKEGKEN